jgi:hypothetical protein
MTTNVCFINGAPCGIGAEIARLPLVDGYYVTDSGRKEEAAATPHCSDNFLDVARRDKAETAAQLPIIAVVFTVGGPVVYQQLSHRLA